MAKIGILIASDPKGDAYAGAAARIDDLRSVEGSKSMTGGGAGMARTLF